MVFVNLGPGINVVSQTTAVRITSLVAASCRSRVLVGGLSIPACEGKPRHLAMPWRPARVYPRVCGETAMTGAPTAPTPGLSPRVRGNQLRIRQDRLPLGSIPACAGKPHHRDVLEHLVGVYPRVCGETFNASTRARSNWGLSPRVRGNHGAGVRPLAEAGSIPACAGKPCRSHASPCLVWVYPRVCGETTASRCDQCRASGLSPRVRGNHDAAREAATRGGSIPACAGKPRHRQ